MSPVKIFVGAVSNIVLLRVPVVVTENKILKQRISNRGEMTEGGYNDEENTKPDDRRWSTQKYRAIWCSRARTANKPFPWTTVRLLFIYSTFWTRWGGYSRNHRTPTDVGVRNFNARSTFSANGRPKFSTGCRLNERGRMPVVIFGSSRKRVYVRLTQRLVDNVIIIIL